MQIETRVREKKGQFFYNINFLQIVNKFFGMKKRQICINVLINNNLCAYSELLTIRKYLSNMK